MAKWLILSLSIVFYSASGYGQTANGQKLNGPCRDRHFQDSLLKKYIDSGAEKLRGLYNNPAWESYCDSVIAICPDIATAWQMKGIPYIKNGEYAKAFAFNDRAVALDPQRYTSYRGFLKCIFTKDYEGAITDFKRAQALTPGGFEMDHSYMFYEGLCNLELGRYSNAEDDLKEDVRIQQRGDTSVVIHFNTLLYIGIVYYEMHRYRMAKEYLEKCLQQYGSLPEANYYLALNYECTGDRKSALNFLELAAQAIRQGYTMNEDNLYYANYPHQITLYEVVTAIAAIHKRMGKKRAG